MRKYIVFMLLLVLLTSCTDPSVPTILPATPSAVPTSLPTTPSQPPLLVTTSVSMEIPSVPTPISYPTLTAEERQAFVREMLNTNDGCELPCWWGVVPGQSDWPSVLDRFIGYGGFVFDFSHPDRLFDYRVSLDFDEQAETIQSIQVTGEIPGGTTSEHFAQDWHRYSLDQVLTRYGEPSQVMLQWVPPLEGGNPPYILLVFYDHLGFAVLYLGSATYDGTAFEVCPAFDQVTYISLWLQASDNETSLMERAITSDEAPYYRFLEEVTGMSLEVFYNTFRSPDSQVCLEGPPTLP